MVVFLIGYMGCGKSTIGKKLSSLLGWKFVDMDHAIEQEQGMSIAQIFEQKGELAFREMEREWLKKQAVGENEIVATGGGVPCFNGNMELINSLGLSVYLKLEATKFTTRISLRGREKRPLLRGMNDEQLTNFVTEKLKEREPYYEKAKILIDINGRSDEYITSHIAEVIKFEI
ncbi:MAG: shikimate kinase [Rikenellaceae bacterium]